MKFTVSTKPLANSLELGVIAKNISKYYVKSCVAQLTATRNTLRINLEASSICTEILLKGSGDADETTTRFVDCSLLKQLVSTFEASTTTIEFADGGIILHSGTSKFSLSQITESTEDMNLKRPAVSEFNAPTIKIEGSDWKFISDFQMYAIAMSFVHPVYTRVWVGSSGDVIVGDFDNSLFTFSKKSKLGETCLLTDTIVNLFNSLPEGAVLSKLADSYRIDVKTDAFEYAAEFQPMHEDDENIGSYNSDMILQLVADESCPGVTVSVETVNKLLNQASLLARSSDDSITISLEGNELRFKDANVDCRVPVTGECESFSAEFETDLVKSCFSHIDDTTVKVSPMLSDGVTAGLIVRTKNMAAMIGSREE